MLESRKRAFMERWEKYFPGVELPLAFFYTNDPDAAPPAPAPEGWMCLVGALAPVRKGESRLFRFDNIGCSGGKRYSGFSDQLMSNFEFFLSCGIPDVLEGERYKKSPEVVRRMMETFPEFKAPAPYLVFKRWDMLALEDEPDALIFYATPDVLSGLFTLAGFDEADANSVIAPFAAGCGSIILYPYLEQQKDNPRAVLGMFDVSARPFVKPNVLTFTVPMKRFNRMLDNMDESFLITKSWEKVRGRIGRTGGDA